MHAGYPAGRPVTCTVHRMSSFKIPVRLDCARHRGGDRRSHHGTDMTMKNELKNQLRQQDASALAQGYSPAIRAMEIASIVTFVSLESALVWRLWGNPHTSPWL